MRAPAHMIRPPRARARSRALALRGLGADKTIPEMSTGVTVPEMTSESLQTVQQLAELYDRTKPQQTFAQWASAQGYAALIASFRGYLTALGATDALQAIDAQPPPLVLTPAEKIAKFDAPTTGGPWALDANGRWFEFKGAQPAGSQVINADGRAIYVPAEHPSTRVKEDNYGAGTAHRKRWTDQKFRAANRALLGSDPFKTLFHRVAPRGGWGAEGQGFGYAFNGTDEDYDFEGGELYPGLSAGPEAQALADWYGKNSFDNRYGYDRGLTLNWLRVYTDAQGYRRYKPWSSAEASDFSTRWHMAAPGYVCGGDEVHRIAADTMGRQAERQGAQTERDYSVHWPWIIGPLSQCSPTSSSRRRKAIKKAAAIAAVVTGAIFLGPTIAGAVKGAAAKIGAVIGKGGIAKAAADVIPKVVEGVNAVQAIKAVKDGEVPPPPISVDGTRFVDYAAAIGTNYLQREVQDQRQQVSAAQQQLEQQLLEQEIRRLQQQTIATLPVAPSQVPMYPIQTLAQPLVSSMAASAAGPDYTKIGIAAALALGVGLLLSRR